MTMKKILIASLLTAFALESKAATVEMLDEVSEDMRLEWPGKRIPVSRSRFSERFADYTPRDQ